MLTHCNAGGLATAEYGTALAVLFAAHEQGRRFRVFVDETRPLLRRLCADYRLQRDETSLAKLGLIWYQPTADTMTLPADVIPTLTALRDADRIVICPSNPLISIGPILAVKGIRESLRARRESVVAVCPIVGGKSLKGPSDKMLAELAHEASAEGVAKLYADFTGTFVIDPVDEPQRTAIESFGMKVAVIPTVMKTRGDKRKLARALLTL